MQHFGPILLTGARGFIGRRLVHWLQQNGQAPYIIDLRHWRREGGEIQMWDLDGHSRPLRDQHDCTLIHLAWCQPVRDSFQPHAEQIFMVSELLHNYGRCLARMIGVGSAEEYGDRSGHLTEEEAVNENLSPYGWGKRSAQMLVETWSRITGKPTRWLRPFLVYGEGQDGNMAIPYAIRQARLRQPAMFSAGTQRRDFIHVDDVARAIGQSVQSSWEGFKVANLGTGIATPMRQVLEQLSSILGAEGLFHFGARPMRRNEPDVQIAVTDAAWQQFGFQSQITIAEGLRRLQMNHTL